MKLKKGAEHMSTVSKMIAAVAVIVGAVIGFEARYAHADDMKSIINNQNAILRSIQTQQKQQLMYQIETWEFQLRKLEEQWRAASQNPRMYPGFSPKQLQDQMYELRGKIENAKKLLVTS